MFSLLLKDLISDFYWAKLYRKFHNYDRDKHWSSQECKTNMGYALAGKAAEFVHSLNVREPNLPYYDLLNRLEESIECQESSALSPVNTYIHQKGKVKHNARNMLLPCVLLPLTFIGVMLFHQLHI